MSRTTSIDTFASNEAVTPALGPGAETHTSVYTRDGVATTSVHLGDDARITAEFYPAHEDSTSHQSFAAVRINCGASVSGVTLFVSPDSVDAAVALRAELNKAIRFARKQAGARTKAEAA